MDIKREKKQIIDVFSIFYITLHPENIAIEVYLVYLSQFIDIKKRKQ